MNAGPSADIRLDYHPERAVDRPEAGRVHELVADLATGRPGETRAVAFVSESGTGKTWLLRHLADDSLTPDDKPLVVGKALSDISGVHALYIRLGDWTGSADGAVCRLMVCLSRRIADLQGAVPTGTLGRGASAPPSDLSRWLEADVRRLTAQGTLVLLVDQAYESSWDLLELLDRHLLGPLAAISRVLVVLAGRGRGYPWTSPELRLHCERIVLGPFDLSQTAEQLRKQFSAEKAARAEEIYQHSGGYPRSNYAIALLGIEDGLAAEVEMLLAPVPAERREQIRQYLEALCVLRTFDEDRIPPMLAAYCEDDRYRQWSYQQAVDVRKELVGYAFAIWEDSAGGWVVDRAVALAFRQRLARSNHPLWLRLHCAAYRLYRNWVKEYPLAASTWQPEADYHAERLGDEFRVCAKSQNNRPDTAERVGPLASAVGRL